MENHCSSGALGYTHLWKTCLKEIVRGPELDSPVEDLLGRALLLRSPGLHSPVEHLLGRALLFKSPPLQEPWATPTCERRAWKNTPPQEPWATLYLWKTWTHLWKTCLEELDSPVEDLHRRAGLTCGRPAWKSTPRQGSWAWPA